MKLPVPAMCHPNGIGAACQIVRSPHTDEILLAIARRLEQLQQLRKQNDLHSVVAHSMALSSVEIKRLDGVTSQRVRISQVRFEVSQQYTVVLIICAKPEVAGTAITIHADGLAQLLAELEGAQAHCEWCGCRLSADDGNQCEVCTRVEQDAPAVANALTPG